MKAKFFVPALLFMLPLFLNAVSSGDLMGVVINLDTRQAIGKAVVVIENYYYKATVTANEHGYYYASQVPEGRYRLTVIYKQRTFIMNRVKVYDGYANEVNFFVSNADTLPPVVKEITPDPVIKIFQQNDIVITSSGMDRATMPFSDILMAQPGIDIYNGRLYIKGYSNGGAVKIFIDGTPVLAPAVFNK